MLRVALTGGIGTGKSTASKILNELGACIFDADKEAKNILKNNETVQSELIAESVSYTHLTLPTILRV